MHVLLARVPIRSTSARGWVPHPALGLRVNRRVPRFGLAHGEGKAVVSPLIVVEDGSAPNTDPTTAKRQVVDRDGSAIWEVSLVVMVRGGHSSPVAQAQWTGTATALYASS